MRHRPVTRQIEGWEICGQTPNKGRGTLDQGPVAREATTEEKASRLYKKTPYIHMYLVLIFIFGILKQSVKSRNSATPGLGMRLN
jgi:hypothetical protein